VVGQEVPAPRGPLRLLLCRTRKAFHELLVLYPYAHGEHTDSATVADPSRVANASRIAGPTPVERPLRSPTNGAKMTAPAPSGNHPYRR
jgi:hypothetical protein